MIHFLTLFILPIRKGEFMSKLNLERHLLVANLYKQHGAYKEVGKILGISKQSVYRLYQSYLKDVKNGLIDDTTGEIIQRVAKPDQLTLPNLPPDIIDAMDQNKKWDQKGDEATAEFISDEKVETPEDVLRKGNVDGTIWEVERFVLNKWDGFYTKGKKENRTHVTVLLWQVKVFLKRKRIDTEKFIKEVCERMTKHSPVYDAQFAIMPESGYLLELDVMDLHIGKLSWKPETNGNWDIKIAIKASNDAIDGLLSRTSVYKFDKILMPVGNDLLHVDNFLNETANGTKQDCDGRSHKMFMSALDMLVKQIDRLSAIAPVVIPIVPGNHDLISTFHLGIALYSWYHNNPRVTVDISPMRRKYFEFGKVLIGFCHGAEGDPKISDLPLIMAQEQSRAFTSAIHKHWHIGHYHKSKQISSMLTEDSFQGIVVRIIRSLTVADYWHYGKGYIQPHARGAEAFVYHIEEGMIQHNLIYAKD